ncbi:hypothetical protein Landi51_12164 [Colletotrichum acutatum]
MDLTTLTYVPRVALRPLAKPVSIRLETFTSWPAQHPLPSAQRPATHVRHPRRQKLPRPDTPVRSQIPKPSTTTTTYHPNTTSADCDPWTVTLHCQHHPSIITIPDITARHQTIAPIRIGTSYYLLFASDDQ